VRKLIAALSAAAFMAVLSVPLASAAPRPRPRPQPKIFNFPKEVIEGWLAKPNFGGVIHGTVTGKRPPLIDYRVDFVPEMVKATLEL